MKWGEAGKTCFLQIKAYTHIQGTSIKPTAGSRCCRDRENSFARKVVDIQHEQTTTAVGQDQSGFDCWQNWVRAGCLLLLLLKITLRAKLTVREQRSLACYTLRLPKTDHLTLGKHLASKHFFLISWSRATPLADQHPSRPAVAAHCTAMITRSNTSSRNVTAKSALAKFRTSKSVRGHLDRNHIFPRRRRQERSSEHLLLRRGTSRRLQQHWLAGLGHVELPGWKWKDRLVDGFFRLPSLRFARFFTEPHQYTPNPVRTASRFGRCDCPWKRAWTRRRRVSPLPLQVAIAWHADVVLVRAYAPRTHTPKACCIRVRGCSSIMLDDVLVRTFRQGWRREETVTYGKWPVWRWMNCNRSEPHS